jgi:hypothetical protein
VTTRRRLTDETARKAMRFAMVALLVSTTVLQRIGVGSDNFSVSPALVAIYLVLGVGAVGGNLVISATRVALYLLAIGVALVSALLNEDRSSFPSLLLLVVMYLPFIFFMEPGSLAVRDGDWLMRQFLNLMFLCAGVGILQFFAQFAIHGEWLFDYPTLIPAGLRGGGVFNPVIPVGSFNKSNGFFFREPSSFSFLMALAVIGESVTRKRVFRIACCALALLLTYSGTGILVLLIGASYPLGRKTLLRLGVIACVGAVIFALFDDALNLSYTVSRFGEFSADSSRSSGYIRYIAPGRLLGEMFFSDPWSAWVGHGPGTIFRTVREYEFHDPTWAKLLFEYGALGFVLFLALFAESLRRPGIPVQLRATLFWAWLITGGHLLSPEQNYLTLALVGLLPFAVTLSARSDSALDEPSYGRATSIETKDPWLAPNL